MAEFNIDTMARNVAEKALEYVYEGKTIREWVEEIKKISVPRPVYYEGAGADDGTTVCAYVACPNCEYAYEEGDKDWSEPFCPRCGQALKWDCEEDREEGAKEGDGE